jgi:hypothetical protein
VIDFPCESNAEWPLKDRNGVFRRSNSGCEQTPPPSAKGRVLKETYSNYTLKKRRKNVLRFFCFEFKSVIFHIKAFGFLGKRPLGRPRRRSVDNIKMDLLEIGWGGVDWIGLTQDRDKWRTLVNAVLNLRVP